MKLKNLTTGKATPSGQSVLWDAVFDGDGNLVAYVDGEDVARLFAASQDLLAACQAVLANVGRKVLHPSHPQYENALAVIADREIAINKVKAAVAKATGKEQP